MSLRHQLFCALIIAFAARATGLANTNLQHDNIMQKAEIQVFDGARSVNFTAEEVAGFWSKVERVSGCWMWRSGKTSTGYGNWNHRGRSMKAHRVAYLLTKGNIPKGEGYHGTCVCHRCDVRLCVNPDHLWLGTQADNNMDRAEKGRGNAPRGDMHHARKCPERLARGERSGNTTLSERDVHAIRSMAIEGIGSSEIAARFHIRRWSVWAIVKRKTWGHI